MYADQNVSTTAQSPATAEQLAELTGYLRRWASMAGKRGDDRDAAIIMSEALDLIGMQSIAAPLKRLRDLVGGDGAQPRKVDAV